MRALSLIAKALGLTGLVPRIARPVARQSYQGGRSRSRNRYSGAELRRIRREGQARECARRLRRKAVQG
jgi:hypothetical protein